MKYLILPIVVGIFALQFMQPAPLFAADAGNCYDLYNGGITDKQYCPTPIPTQSGQTIGNKTSLNANPQTPQRTKGGQVVYPPSQSQTTPGTGPETWAIAVLLPLAGLGFLLRNKALTTKRH